MTLEFTATLPPRPASDLLPPLGPALQPEFVAHLARAYDRSPFSAVLIGQTATSVDAVVLAQAVLAASERIGVVITVPPALVDPVAAARAVGTLAAFHPGRVRARVPAAGGDAGRAAEFGRLLQAVWRSSGPLDHRGTHYVVDRHWSVLRPDPVPRVVADLGVDADGDADAAQWADHVTLPAGAPHELAVRVARLRQQAGQRAPRVSVALRPVVGADATEVAALRSSVLRIAPTCSDAAAAPHRGEQRMLAAVTGAFGAVAPFVGDVDAVAARLHEYVEVGVDGFHLRGFDPVGDVDRYAPVVAAVHSRLVPGRNPHVHVA